MSGEAADSMLDKLVELLYRKKTLLNEFFEVTCQQSGLLEPEKVERLLGLIDRKQACIDSINQIDVEITHLEKKIPAAAGVSSFETEKYILGGKWEIIERLRHEIALLLKETHSLDVQNRFKINEAYRKLKKIIESLHARKGTVKAYQGHVAQSGGYFVDDKR